MSCRIYSGCGVYVRILLPYLYSRFIAGRFSSTSAGLCGQTSGGQDWEGLKWRQRKTGNTGPCKDHHASLESGGPLSKLLLKDVSTIKDSGVCVVSTPDGIWKNKKTYTEKKPKATVSIGYGKENIFHKSLRNVWRRNDDHILPGFCLTIKWTKMNCHRYNPLTNPQKVPNEKQHFKIHQREDRYMQLLTFYTNCNIGINALPGIFQANFLNPDSE